MNLNTVADVLRVHPRTILRALTRELNPYWAPGYDPEVRLAEVAVVFGCSPNTLREICRQRIPLYTQKEAAEYTKIPQRTFRDRGYNPALYLNDKIYRYTPTQLEKIKLNDQIRGVTR
jgi:hypothetical protein